ncbi:hypothetical protein LECLMA074M_11020 [Leclercia sp. M-A074-M]
MNTVILATLTGIITPVKMLYIKTVFIRGM